MSARFDELIHSPVRLRICGLLLRVDEIEFAAIRETLDLSDANLSKNLKILADAGYTKLRKASSPGKSDARRRAWVSLTLEGRRATRAHLEALAEIAEGSGI